MAGFLNRLLGRAEADPLAQLLADYPPNRPRHVGDMAALSEAARDDNLAQLVDEREERLRVVLAFLSGRGIDAAPMLAPGGDGATGAVDGWLNATLPRRTLTILGDEHPNPPVDAYRASDRSGPDIFYSLIADLALLEGEAIRRRDPRFDWTVNRLPALRQMPSYHRICLIKPGQPGWAATVLDLPEHLLAIVHRKAAPGGDAGGHSYGKLLAGAVRRAFDPG